MIKVQYALVPFKYLEIKNSPKIYDLFAFLKPKNLVVKIALDKKPYIEELITKNRIGLTQSDEYRMYLKGNVIYKLCSKEEAYVKAMNIKNYKKTVVKLFKN